jgi:hypothetical protein
MILSCSHSTPSLVAGLSPRRRFGLEDRPRRFSASSHLSFKVAPSLPLAKGVRAVAELAYLRGIALLALHGSPPREMQPKCKETCNPNANKRDPDLSDARPLI